MGTGREGNRRSVPAGRVAVPTGPAGREPVMWYGRRRPRSHPSLFCDIMDLYIFWNDRRGLWTPIEGLGHPDGDGHQYSVGRGGCVFGVGHAAINYLLLCAVVDDGIGLIIIAVAYPSEGGGCEYGYLGLVV